MLRAQKFITKRRYEELSHKIQDPLGSPTEKGIKYLGSNL